MVELEKLKANKKNSLYQRQSNDADIQALGEIRNRYLDKKIKYLKS